MNWDYTDNIERTNSAAVDLLIRAEEEDNLEALKELREILEINLQECQSRIEIMENLQRRARFFGCTCDYAAEGQ